MAASRTDAGVHARGYVCNFYTKAVSQEKKFKIAINIILPEDIVFWNQKRFIWEFHARFSAKGKTYTYIILIEKPAAIGRNYIYHYKRNIRI